MQRGECRCYMEQTMNSPIPPRKVLRFSALKDRVPYSRVQVWRKSNDPDDDFPAAVELGPNAVGWFEDEVEAWLASRPRRGSTPAIA